MRWIASVGCVRNVGYAGNVRTLRESLAVTGALIASLAFGGATHLLRAQNTPVNASALRAGQFVYDNTLERDVSTTHIGTRAVSVALGTYAGSSVWVLAETRTLDAGGVSTDSLFTDTTTLRPLHWSSVIGAARLLVEFRGDSAYGGTSGPPGRHSLVTGIPRGTIVSAAQLETILRLVPLQPAWEDSASTLFVTLGSTMVLPTRMAVIGEDRVRVPAGQFDCWVVSVRAADATRGLYWVTKRDPIVVRSALDVPAMGGAQFVSALSRIGR